MIPRCRCKALSGPLGMPGVTAWVKGQPFHPAEGRRDSRLFGGDWRGRHGGWADRQSQGRPHRRHRRRPGKCGFAVEELGYNLCVDHKAADFAQQLAPAATPNGVDGLFENVGGQPRSALTIARMNDFARIAICGLIASYEGAETTSLN